MRGMAFVLMAALPLAGCGDPNAKLKYGDSGFPKNCRALIKANIDGWRSGAYSPTEALESIDRNCGEYGSTWAQ